MKVADYFWENPALVSYLREIPAGEFLFEEGEAASCMYVVVRGAIELRAGKKGKGRLVSIVGAGEFLGEKAILTGQPYPRAFSAQAKSRVLVLELRIETFEKLKTADSSIASDLLREMFLTAAVRLDRSNSLIGILRSSNNVERVVNLLVYYGTQFGRNSPKGLQVYLPKDTILFYIDINPHRIDLILNELLAKGLLTQEDPDNYTVPDTNLLLAGMSTLTEKITTGLFDDLEIAP
jgi:CRP-like cAMP-binding protein